jgi:hypothetical protein
MGLKGLKRYVSLIQSFLTNAIDARTFEREYLYLFKGDSTEWSQTEYAVLNELFSDVDAFCDDPALIGPGDLSEAELRERSSIALEKLCSLSRDCS